MTPELRERIAYLLFYQRPIAAQRHLVGTCELERGDSTHSPQKRAPWASMAAQRFRILQTINDLRVIDPRKNVATPLSADERAGLYRLLDLAGTQSFTKIRKHLGIPKELIFNMEENGSKELQGNRTQKIMLKVFGPRWLEFSPGKQNQIVENWRNSESNETLMQEAKEHLHLDDAASAFLISESAPWGYCSLSFRAISRLLPGMLDGRPFKQVQEEVYGDRLSELPTYKKLPDVREILPTLRNPALERAITEMRKVVNSIVTEHDKPYEIRIELAPELKKLRGNRQKDTSKSLKREMQRIQIAKKLSQEFSVEHPGRKLIEKAILHTECGGICPYSGLPIPYTSLINEAEFTVQYIIPRTRFPDSSFQNKTLCHLSMNPLKGNRTPWEMCRERPDEYDKILDRVRAWPIRNRGKLDRFLVGGTRGKDDNTLENFGARLLNDTRFTSVAVAKFLATLYGGRDVQMPDGRKRTTVYANSGFITAALRSTWGLEEILRGLVLPQPGELRGKPRIDHRHHAIDAIAVAAIRPSVVIAMAHESEGQIDRATPCGIKEPWGNFVDTIRPHIEQLLVSHRPEHKLSGELHGKTNYSRPYQSDEKSVVHVRKRVSCLTPKDLANIVDANVRKSVMDKAAELAGNLSICELKHDWPVLCTRNGDRIPIKKVRLQKVLDVTPIGDETTRRYVAESNNHHIAIYAQLNEHGEAERWDGVVVSRLEAHHRAATARKEKGYKKDQTSAIVQRSLPARDNLRFKFSLMGGDTVELHRTCKHSESLCRPEIYRIRSIAASGQLSLVKINDARMKREIFVAGDWWQPRVDALRKLHCRKVVIDLQGRKRYAND